MKYLYFNQCLLHASRPPRRKHFLQEYLKSAGLIEIDAFEKHASFPASAGAWPLFVPQSKNGKDR
tara:strand:- start:414 stop:608 length:195 start_codon:yes stop_codon:yes gene_type:complete